MVLGVFKLHQKIPAKSGLTQLVMKRTHLNKIHFFAGSTLHGAHHLPYFDEQKKHIHLSSEGDQKKLLFARRWSKASEAQYYSLSLLLGD